MYGGREAGALLPPWCRRNVQCVNSVRGHVADRGRYIVSRRKIRLQRQFVAFSHSVAVVIEQPPEKHHVLGNSRGGFGRSRWRLGRSPSTTNTYLSRGGVYLSGTQALVRLPMMQRQRDVAAGSNRPVYLPAIAARRWAASTGAWGARQFLERHHIRFQPGVNEDLAATAVWGSQQSVCSPAPNTTASLPCGTARDRASTAAATLFKHGNAAGTGAARRRADRSPATITPQILDPGAPVRIRLHGRLPDPGAVSRLRPGIPRPRPARLGDESLLRLSGSRSSA